MGFRFLGLDESGAGDSVGRPGSGERHSGSWSWGLFGGSVIEIRVGIERIERVEGIGDESDVGVFVER